MFSPRKRNNSRDSDNQYMTSLNDDDDESTKDGDSSLDPSLLQRTCHTTTTTTTTTTTAPSSSDKPYKPRQSSSANSRRTDGDGKTVRSNKEQCDGKHGPKHRSDNNNKRGNERNPSVPRNRSVDNDNDQQQHVSSTRSRHSRALARGSRDAGSRHARS